MNEKTNAIKLHISWGDLYNIESSVSMVDKFARLPDEEQASYIKW